MKQKTSKTFYNIGITSIVLIFVMMCLLTFSVLSLVSAKADYSLSRKSADRTTDYYTAENQAADILQDIAICTERLAASADEETFYRLVCSELENVDSITFPDEQHLAYTVPLGDEQLLSVSLTLSYKILEDGNHYQIDSWKTVSTHEWNPDTGLPVWDSESISDITKGE